jgi:aldehyde dehydrogenase (NAD+)
MDIHGIVDLQRRYFESGVTLDLQGRLDALDRLREVILKHEDEINAALYADLGKSATESYMCEIGMTLSELSYIRNHLSRWTRDHSVRTPMSQFHAKSFTVQEPYGIVLIMSPWNYPFMLCMDPLIGAIAAGNCCVLKPSAYSPATSAIIRKIIAEAYEEQYVTVVEGGRAENTALLEQHFDYIFFTGGVAVGRQVLEKAARYLTPVTLELGGKSPCIVDKTADLPLAARRIAFGKYLNLGQTCVAPDYLLIDRSIKDQFLGMLKKEIALQYGEKPLENPNYGKIINQKHFDRLMHLMDPAKIVIGGESDPEKLRIAPTVMDTVTAEDAVMGEEIFGPILPILTYDSIQEAEQFIRSRPHPLALYLFTTDEKTEQRFLHHVPFGGGCINDTIIHLATSAMPFGGVGQSGMGGYHGKKSFETFSHQKSIVKKSNWIDMKVRYQPYTNKKKRMLRLFLK